MARIDIFTKDAADVLDYQIDWSDWLPEGDTISTASWSVDTGMDVEDTDATTTTSTVWVSGGTHGEQYEAANHIITVQGREKTKTLIFKAKAQ
jgi:hypothetical protein